MIYHQSKTNGSTLIELTIVVAVIGILAAVAIPQYQLYVYKSHVQRVVAEAGSLRHAVELCLLNGRASIGNPALPGNCDPHAAGSNLQMTAGNAAPTVEETWSEAGSGVPQIILSASGSSRIVATFGNAAGAPLQTRPAGTITWTRTAEGSWECRAANIDPKYASLVCPL